MSQHFNRRKALGVAGVAGMAGAMVAGPSASALAKLVGLDVEPRGTDGILERLPSLDLESYDEMSTSTRMWINSELTSAAEKRAHQILKANGYGPDEELPRDDAIEMLKDDPHPPLAARSD